MKTGVLQHLKPFQKISLLFAIVLFSVLLFSLLTAIGFQFLFNLDISQIDFNDFTEIQNIRVLKILVVVNQLAIFMIPAILGAYLFSYDPKEMLFIHKNPKTWWILIPFLFVIFTVLNSIFQYINQSLDFSFLGQQIEESLKYSQGISEKRIYAFIGLTWSSFITNVFLIAVLPAIGEELFFRGILQHLIIKGTRKIHIGILLSAFIFAIFHVQPYSFLPLFLLGTCYGYIAYFSGSLLIGMLLHFLNNFFALSVQYAVRLKWINPEDLDGLVLLLGLAIAIVAVVILFKKSKVKLNNLESSGIYFR